MPSGVYVRRIPPKTRPLAERFWAKVDRSGGPDACWLWTASTFASSGYGRIAVDGESRPAHRVAWELTHGPIPPGLFVCHRCDVKRCCNPSHLFLGLPSDNTADMLTKGREARGERQGSAKLTADAVRVMRTGYAERRYGWRDAHREYGLGKSQFFRIIRREDWRHVD